MSPKLQRQRHEEEDLYLDWEDQKQLEALPEVEREKILYERYIERVRANERKEIEQRVRSFGEESESDSFSRESEKVFPQSSAKSTYEVFKCIVLSRDTLLKIVYRRAIDKLKGYYIKIRLPTGYSIYKISDVYEGKKYELGGIVTNKWMVVQRKKDRKEINIQSISNVLATEEEYREYLRENVVPGDKEALKMWKKISREVEADLSEEELNYSLSQRRRFLRYSKVVTRRKIELKALLDRARDEHNTEQIAVLEKELKELEEE
ncbi:hypothetical protein NEHOM01_0101 [Nematocida homosporus]|uniref:uncharacterized protein n=1 Tax=Nematocida homosporus TaxID=1912981 RepID=UPI00221F160B|nr:uncharacterized protein NEHOM01_0101 [Nematocida homosporus]KAI5184356.1 hypothetical protein NEHOM01_0101 [Nematocida homosporus]